GAFPIDPFPQNVKNCSGNIPSPDDCHNKSPSSLLVPSDIGTDSRCSDVRALLACKLGKNLLAPVADVVRVVHGSSLGSVTVTSPSPSSPSRWVDRCRLVKLLNSIFRVLMKGRRIDACLVTVVGAGRTAHDAGDVR